MAEGSATQPSRLIRTICLPVSEEQYRQLVNEPARFRGFLDACWADMPELFPEGFEAGYEMKTTAGRERCNSGFAALNCVTEWRTRFVLPLSCPT